MENILGQLGGFAKPSENIDAKIENAHKEKEQGNTFFKNGNNKQALYYYNRALLNVKGLNGLSDAQTRAVNDLKVVIHNNMAAALMKDERWTRVEANCNQVLAIDSNNLKALFRRGKAYLSLGNLDKAEADLTKAERLDPNDKAIKKELAVLKQKTKQAEQKQKKFYANMFEKMQTEDANPANVPANSDSIETPTQEAPDSVADQ